VTVFLFVREFSIPELLWENVLKIYGNYTIGIPENIWDCGVYVDVISERNSWL
jgi:hypothetical protein